MSEYTGSYAPDDTSSGAAQGAAEAAWDEASGVGQHARDAGSEVVQTAVDQARQVVADTGRQARGLLGEAQGQARDLLGEAQGQLRDQAAAQQQKAAQQLRTLADELREMVATGGQSGLAAELAGQAAERIQGAASWLEQRNPGDLLEGIRDFARRRPGVFLAGAAVAGLAAGRLTRGLASGSDRQDGTPQNALSGVPATAGSPPVGGGLAEAAYPASTEPGYPAEYPAAPGYAAGPGFRSEAGYSSAPDYPAEPAYPGEPGTAPHYTGPGQP